MDVEEVARQIVDSALRIHHALGPSLGGISLTGMPASSLTGSYPSRPLHLRGST